MIASSLGYDERGRIWFVYRISYLSVGHKKIFEDAGMRPYLPTYQSVRFVRGKKVNCEVPKILNYIFVLGTLEQVNSLIRIRSLYPVRNRFISYQEEKSAENVWLTVPSRQMHSLMIVAQGCEREVEFCLPKDQRLERGDRVLVTDGPFAGVEGVLLTNQGCRKGGRVYVGITEDFGTKTAAVPDECIQILEFSRSTNHFFRKLEGVEKLLESAVGQKKNDGALPPQQVAALKSFLVRYSRLEGLTYLNRVKLDTCRYVACTLLGDRRGAESFLAPYVQTDGDAATGEDKCPSARRYMDKWTAMTAEV